MKRPHFVKGTMRQFKSLKRKELRAIAKAVEVFRFGCAYTPSHGSIYRLASIVEEMQNELSVKQWGR